MLAWASLKRSKLTKDKVIRSISLLDELTQLPFCSRTQVFVLPWLAPIFVLPAALPQQLDAFCESETWCLIEEYEVLMRENLLDCFNLGERC